jgi:hypothetical protein
MDGALFLKINKIKSGRNKMESNIPTKLFTETEPNQNESQEPTSQ